MYQATDPTFYIFKLYNYKNSSWRPLWILFLGFCRATTSPAWVPGRGRFSNAPGRCVGSQRAFWTMGGATVLAPVPMRIFGDCSNCSCPSICGVALFSCDGSGVFECPLTMSNQSCNLPGEKEGDGICDCPETCRSAWMDPLDVFFWGFHPEVVFVGWFVCLFVWNDSKTCYLSMALLRWITHDNSLLTGHFSSNFDRMFDVNLDAHHCL